jgi:demethylmenaquinone methyltransferase/2-methoxy-6-polyprenyl-1,4-benzoquinol methylase
MRWLEGSPERYDGGMRALTFGRVGQLHDAVAEAAVPAPGKRVLEIGCGTGAVSERMARRGAAITAIDQSPEMLEQAAARLSARGLAGVEWLEQTASEIDRMPEHSFDAVVICLCLSDMSRDERVFVLRESARLLAPGGRLVAADEVVAPAGWRRALQVLWRIPQAMLAWLLVGSTSRPLAELVPEIERGGLRVRSQASWLGGTLALVVAEPLPFEQGAT